MDDNDRLRLREAGRKLLEESRLKRARQHAVSTTPTPAPPSIPVTVSQVGNGEMKVKENGLSSGGAKAITNGDGGSTLSNSVASSNDAAAREKMQVQKILGLQQEKALYLQKVEQLEREKKELDETLVKHQELHKKELEERTKELEEARVALAEKRASGANLVSRLQVQLIEVQTENEALKKEEMEWRDQERESRERILIQEKEIQRLEEEKGLLNTELNVLENRIQELTEKDKFWQQEHRALNERIAELEGLLRSVGSKTEGEEEKVAALQAELHQKEEKYRSEMKAMNTLLSEQVETCKKLTNQLKSFERMKGTTTPVDEVAEEKRLFMLQIQKREEELNKEKEDMAKELALVKSKLSHIEKAELGKFRQMYQIIDELKAENQQLKEKLESTSLEDASDPSVPRRSGEEQDKLHGRLQEQRKLIETLMKSKTQLMNQLGNEVKRNGGLVKENAALVEAAEQQNQEMKEKKRKLKMKIKRYKEMQGIEATTEKTAKIKKEGQGKEKEKEKKDTSEEAVEGREVQLYSTEGGGGQGTSMAGASLSIVPKRKENEVVVLKATGWFSWLPFLGRKTFNKSCEIVV